jgi:predicted PurR-regulated permease PerM
VIPTRLRGSGTDFARRSFVLFFGAAALVFTWVVLRPLLAPIVLGVLAAVVFQPVHRQLEARLGGEGSRRAAVASLLLTNLFVGAPAIGLAILFLVQLRSVLEDFLGQQTNTALTSRLIQIVNQYIDWASLLVGRYVGSTVDLHDSARQAILNLGSALYERLPDIVGYLGGILIAYLVLNIVLFFVFLEGNFVVDLLVELSPLGGDYTRRILRRLEQMIDGVFLGSLLTAAIQGLVGTLGFFVTGFPSFVVWGVLVAGAALIPLIGTALVWGPAVLYLFLTSQWKAGVTLLSFGVVIGTVDNLIRPLLIRTQVPIHPLVIFVAVLGGIQSAGPMGVIYGPLLAAIVVEAVRIYRSDFGSAPKKQEAPTPIEPPPEVPVASAGREP